MTASLSFGSTLHNHVVSVDLVLRLAVPALAFVVVFVQPVWISESFSCLYVILVPGGHCRYVLRSRASSMAQLLSCVAATACGLERKPDSGTRLLLVQNHLMQETNLLVVQKNLMHVLVAVMVFVCVLVTVNDRSNVVSLRS